MKHLLLITLTYVASVLVWGSSFYAQSAQQTFQQAVILEEAQGDLEAAIDLYTAIAEDQSTDRTLRARALLQAGYCYEKLGRKNAVLMFEQLISDFPDQEQFIVLARQKLRELQPPVPVNERLSTELLNHETSTRKLIYSVSPDGKYYVFMNWDSMEIMKYDIESGKESLITSGNTWNPKKENKQYWSNPDHPAWAPNSRQVVYAWHSEYGNELRLRDIDGRNLKILMDCNPGQSIRPLDFTPDGSKVYAVLMSNTKALSEELVLIDIESGTVQSLLDLDAVRIGTRDFDISPSGEHAAFSMIDEDSDHLDIFLLHLKDLSLRRITANKFNDFEPTWAPDGKSLLFVSNRYGNNALLSVNLSEGAAINDPDILARDIGDVVSMMTVTDNWSVCLKVKKERYDVHTLDIDEYLLNGQVNTEQITAKVLGYGGMAPAYSPTGRYISYLSPMSNIRDVDPSELSIYQGSRYFINIYDTETNEHWEVPTELYTNQHWSDINEYVPQWSYDESRLLMHGKTAKNLEGGFYLVDVRSGELYPMITRANSAGTDYFRAGRSPKCSRSGNAFYYVSSNWKELRKFDVATKSETVLYTDSSGFFFTDLSSDESKFLLQNSTGRFIFNSTIGKVTRLDDGSRRFAFAMSSDERYLYVGIEAEFTWVKKIGVVPMTDVGREEIEEIDLTELFPAGRVWLISKHPNEEKLIFSLKTGFGEEVLRMRNVFN